ncbi:vacuolar protein sorting-associated protein 72 homolog [Amphiura filiformis]|uniref:vacuolar protein sorting-associated protein 72 homolog n=1 Tax=Amphiura filiformis TaxID=82378 RepID=UPI003B20D941
MSLASTREKRFNAGNRMSRMLEEEQEDDFYKTTYGGFAEESGDDEFTSDDESDRDSPSSDSDISAPEDDEPISDDDENEPKRKRRVVTKAYTEPLKKPAAAPSTSSSSVSKEKKKSKPIKETPRSSSRKQLPKQHEADLDFADYNVRKSRRSTTMMKHTEFQMRMQEREIKAKQLKATIAKRTTPLVRRLTQEELLEEAKVTEKKNLASLEMYHKLEAERLKKTKVRKKVSLNSFVRYHSMSMPVIQPVVQQPAVQQPAVMPNMIINVDQVMDTGSPPPPKSPVQRCTRNFITFSDDKLYHEAFPKKMLKTRSRPARHVCPITRQQAKYLDPITSIPYANKHAFKIIRDTYMPELEQQMGKHKKSSKKKESSVSSS